VNPILSPLTQLSVQPNYLAAADADLAQGQASLAAYTAQITPPGSVSDTGTLILIAIGIFVLIAIAAR
jgi:hypothetical protein